MTLAGLGVQVWLSAPRELTLLVYTTNRQVQLTKGDLEESLHKP